MQNWHCKSCGTLQPHDELHGGICSICQGYLCCNCAKGFYILCDHPDLDPEYTDYLMKIRPAITDRVFVTLCVTCITKTEMDFLRSYPYEQLPLLINHRWYGTDTEQLYKDRLSGLKT